VLTAADLFAAILAAREEGVDLSTLAVVSHCQWDAITAQSVRVGMFESLKDIDARPSLILSGDSH
jgi:hypothetical protein